MFKSTLASALVAAYLVAEADAHYSWRWHRHYWRPYWYTPVTHSYGWAGAPRTSTTDTVFGGTLLKQSSNTGLTTYIKSYWSGLTSGLTYGVGYEVTTTSGTTTTTTLTQIGSSFVGGSTTYPGFAGYYTLTTTVASLIGKRICLGTIATGTTTLTSTGTDCVTITSGLPNTTMNRLLYCGNNSTSWYCGGTYGGRRLDEDELGRELQDEEEEEGGRRRRGRGGDGRRRRRGGRDGRRRRSDDDEEDGELDPLTEEGEQEGGRLRRRDRRGRRGGADGRNLDDVSLDAGRALSGFESIMEGTDLELGQN